MRQRTREEHTACNQEFEQMRQMHEQCARQGERLRITSAQQVNQHVAQQQQQRKQRHHTEQQLMRREPAAVTTRSRPKSPHRNGDKCIEKQSEKLANVIKEMQEQGISADAMDAKDTSKSSASHTASSSSANRANIQQVNPCLLRNIVVNCYVRFRKS